MSARQVNDTQLQGTRNTNQPQSQNVSDDNENHNKQMRDFEYLQKELVQMKKKLNDASIRCHKLNIDAATMFNPETLTTLENFRDQCDICLARMSQTLNEPLDDVFNGEKEKEE